MAPRWTTASSQPWLLVPAWPVREHPIKPNGARAAAGGGEKSPQISLSPFHPPALPLHSNYRGLGGFHTQSPGPPCSKQLNLFNDSGGPGAPLLSGFVSLVSERFFFGGAGSHHPTFGGEVLKLVLVQVPPKPKGSLTSRDTPVTPDSGKRTCKPIQRVCPSSGGAEPVGRDGGRAAPGHTMAWKGKGKIKHTMRCCCVLRVQPPACPCCQPGPKHRVERNWDAPAPAVV